MVQMASLPFSFQLPWALQLRPKSPFYIHRCFGRFFTNLSREKCRTVYKSDNIRNVGIMAHIDAGKTTLAESMLHVARKAEMGANTDTMNVQLDYMEQEIKRGITIRAACSSFNWGKCHINIVDTPGHTDFSGELYNAMDVIDGCIVMVDGTKGIQAQTKHIYSALPVIIPRIIFINKIDRPGVDVEENMQSIRKHLRVNPVLLNIPKRNSSNSDRSAETVSVLDITSDYTPDCRILVDQLTDSLCDLDENLTEQYLENGSVNREILMKSLRFCLDNSKVVPVICGSAVSLAGVCNLLDGVCELFPSPSNKESLKSPVTENILLYTFKTICGGHGQINAFCKVLSGTMTKNIRLYNAALGKAENAGKIYKIHGNVYLECNQLIEGDVGMIEGMTDVRTGHMLSKNPKNILQTNYSRSSEIDVASKCVCFATFMTKDETENNRLLDAMIKLKIEDPSMYYKYDPDAVEGLVVGGYGEFHLEILAELLRDNYGIDVHIGNVRVAIKEMPIDTVTASMYIDSSNPEDRSHIGLELIMEPMDKDRAGPTQGSNLIISDDEGVLNCQVDDESVILVAANGLELEGSKGAKYSTKTKDIIANVKQLLLNAMAAGPLVGGSMISTRIKISKIKILPHSNVAGAKIVASRVLRSIYKKVPIELQQPLISLNIVVPREYIGNVIPDLRNNRHAEIVDVAEVDDQFSDSAAIIAMAPMKALLGYTKTLRALTNGNATFTMLRKGYCPIQLSEVDKY